MQNGYQCFTPKGVLQQLGATVGHVFLQNMPTPASAFGQWLLQQRHYGTRLVRTTEQKLPATLRIALLKQVLVRLFGATAQSGSLDFLQGKRLSIEVPDLQMHYDIGLDAQRQFWLQTAGHSAQTYAAEVLFRANSHELLLLLSQQADPDTLFFQRRLTVIGDTELGLQLKNFLDTLEPDSLLPPVVMLWFKEIAQTESKAMQS